MIEEKKHNYFYKITNLIDQKFYYGIHSTNNIDDKYMGGGDRISNAVKKYGKENFTKEIIADYPTRKEASDHEKRIVTEELLKDPLCYNLRLGGQNEYGMSQYIIECLLKANLGRKKTPEVIQKTVDKISGENHWSRRMSFTEESKKKMSESTSGEKHPNWGKSLSDETKKRIGDANRGEKSGMYGKPRPKEVRDKISKSLIGNTRAKQTKCIVCGLFFNSFKEAADCLGYSPGYVRNRCKSMKLDWIDWFYFKPTD